MIFGFLTQRKRRNARARAFPSAWKSIITRNVPVFRRLPPPDQAELFGCVQIFLAEKHFEGCGGLELTDEIRVTIAAQACSRESCTMNAIVRSKWEREEQPQSRGKYRVALLKRYYVSLSQRNKLALPLARPRKLLP